MAMRYGDKPAMRSFKIGAFSASYCRVPYGMDLGDGQGGATLRVCDVARAARVAERDAAMYLAPAQYALTLLT